MIQLEGGNIDTLNNEFNDLFKSTFDNERPIYIQLMDIIKNEIVSGNIALGEKLPSVRDFAIKLKINPNTVQKSLMELERLNFIYTERTSGKYVTKDKSLIEKERIKLASISKEKYLEDMKKLGYTKEESIKFLGEWLDGFIRIKRIK